MEQSNVFDFDGFQIERESYLGGDCYGVVTSCKKDGAGIPYHLEVEFDISKARFSFSKCYAHEVVPCDELSAGGKLKIMVYLLEKVACAYVTEKAVVQKMSLLLVWGVYVVCHAYLICKCYLLFLPRHVVLCIQLLLIALCHALM